MSRGEKTTADVVRVVVGDHGVRGHGECVPYPRYGQSVDGVIAEIESVRPALEGGADVDDVQDLLPAGPARNAVECALWDLGARSGRRRASRLLPAHTPLRPLVTAFTISLDTPERMAAVAASAAGRAISLLKLKLGGDGDPERVRAVRAAAPHARLIADANESWSPEQLSSFAPVLAGLGVELLEQPLPADSDDALTGYDGPLLLSADESCQDAASVAGLAGRYAAVTVKLDKTGGIIGAMATLAAARDAGMRTMLGCMVATSLSMAPGLVPAQLAEFVHLDGPLLLARDRHPGLPYDGARVSPSDAVWAT
ncbi:dipeptide epimerase [Pseudonocardia sp. GCM10023141]|uniref:dipeptide epimerase n=1 Tax=Pseudonocardia sp. GCM10023141 TaxID=3252653 RepID=UPI0036178B45